jgi:hypothetical protein
MGSIGDWRPYENYVQDGLVDGRFMSAAFTLLAAGPPRLSALGGASGAEDLAGAAAGGSQGGTELVHPIGVVQNISLAQNRQFSRFWEVGSERSYFVSGRTMGQIGLSRVLYHGPSLLRVLYGYYQDTEGTTQFPALFNNPGITGVANPHDVKVSPGHKNVFLNLASDLFSQPIGLMLYLRDSNEETLGAVYLEACYIPTHNMATDAQGVVMQENVTIQYERMIPVAVGAINLIEGIYGQEVLS